MSITPSPLPDRYPQRVGRNICSPAIQWQMEVGGIDVGYTNGAANAATGLSATSTYQVVQRVPYANERVWVRAVFMNGTTSAVTEPGNSISWAGGFDYTQDHPTSDGSTLVTPTLDHDSFTIPAATADTNSQGTNGGWSGGIAYARSAASGGVPGVVTVTMAAHGITHPFPIYVTSATHAELNGYRIPHVVDANTFTFDNPTSNTTSGTMSVLIQSGYHGVGYSNWVQVDLPTPTDTSTNPYGVLYGRIFPSVALNGMTLNSDNLATDVLVPRVRVRHQLKVANWLTQTSGAWNASTGAVHPFNVQVVGAKQAITVAIMGDSTSAGSGSTSTYLGWNQLAVDSLSSLSRPVVTNSWAWPGQSPSMFFGRAMNLLDYPDMVPDIMIIQPGGQNKGGLGWASVDADWAWGMTLQLINKCYQKGCIPVLRTLTPSADLSAADDLIRIAYNTRIRNAAANGSIPIIDFTGLVTTAGTPQTLTPAYAATNAHLNDAGHTLVYPSVQAVVASLIRKR